MQEIEKEAARRQPLPPPVPPAPFRRSPPSRHAVKPPLLQRMIVGSGLLITINTLIFGFVTCLPQFFLQQGLTIANSFAYSLVLSLGSPVGCGHRRADRRRHRTAPTIIGASLVTIVIGFIYPASSPIRCCCSRSASC